MGLYPVFAVHVFDPLSADGSVLPVLAVYVFDPLSADGSVLPVLAVYVFDPLSADGFVPSVFAVHVFDPLSADRLVFPVFTVRLLGPISADRSVLAVFAVHVFFPGGTEPEGRVTSGHLARVHLTGVYRLDVLLEALRGSVPAHAQGALKVFLLNRLLGSKIIKDIKSINEEVSKNVTTKFS